MGKVIYDGPSKFTGAPIIGVLTMGSANRKLTNRLHAEVVQLWVMPRDEHPLDAMKSGGDAAVCGDCPLRPWRDGEKVARACYVTPMPLNSVWKNIEPGTFTPTQALRGSRANLLRLGAWGDPAALPFDVVNELCEAAQAAGIRRRTGYTHSWPRADIRFRQLIMASCEGTLQALHAQMMGWRTFTVQPRDTPPTSGISCPASDEAGGKTTCERCGLCDGSRGAHDNRANIEIMVHGSPPVLPRMDETIRNLITRHESRARALQELV